MKISGLLLAVMLVASSQAFAADSGAILGGAIGGATGAAIGSQMGGRDGAIIGGAIGGATGAAIGSQNNKGTVQVIEPKKQRVRDDDYDDDRYERRGRHDNGLHLGQRKHRHRDDD